MREILFRGKSELLGWIEGWYCPEVKWGEHHFPVGITHKTKEGWLDDVDVIPETIGQFTGLTDKNGTKIFEGDIVTGLFSFGMEVKSVVVFQDGAFGLRWSRGGAEQFSAFTSICNVEYEVVGNIHDNPEVWRRAENE